MSDTPQGDGWWQASDFKWYPPQPADAAASSKSGPRWVLPTILLVVVALLAAGTTFILAGGDDSAEASVALESSTDNGPDPFTDSVTITEITEFPDTVNAVITTTVQELPADPTTGTLTATGNTPGLYGGTKNDTACDVTALSDYLTNPDNASKAQAWASAAGINTNDIETYLATLTPTVLTTDTRVTNNGYSNGQPTPRQSVLQAGTAVLIDDLGIPRVRCSCGNPLSEPRNINLTNARTTGTAWATYQTNTVTTPTPAPEPITSFTLTDTTTGDPYQQPPGSTVGATWVAVAGGGSSIEGPSFGPAGAIYTSANGADWTKTLDAGAAMNGVAQGDGMFVAVGGTADSAGAIRTSTDGTSWSDAIVVPKGLADVAYGNGRWVATSSTAAFTSTDGTTWTEQAPFAFEFTPSFATAITHDGENFVVLTANCGASRCFNLDLRTSTDGTAWEVGPQAPGDLAGSKIAYSESRAIFGLVGSEMDDAASAPNMASVGSKPLAGTFTLGSQLNSTTISPAGLGLDGLSAAGDAWIAVGAPEGDTGSSGVYTSPDMGAWSQVGSIDDVLTDVVVGGEISAPAEPAGEPEAVSGDIVIRATGLDVADEAGDATDTLSYAQSPAAVIERLNGVLGSEGVSEFAAGDGTCSRDSTIVRWGGFAVVFDGTDAAAATSFTVFLESPTDGVTAPGGIVPGSTLDQVRAAYPGAPDDSNSFEGTQYDAVLADAPPGDPENVQGVVVGLQNSVVTGISAPDYLVDDC